MPEQRARGWTADDIPSLDGQRALVTGANSGLGLQTALALAAHGADVTLACRDLRRGRDAQDAVAAATGRTPRLELLDLADLRSVRELAERWGAEEPLHLLVANAGLMAVPYGTTTDGFERQLGTNHLGHFALVGRLLPALRQAPFARVVVVSSQAHRFGRVDLDDLQWQRRRYRPWPAYGQSKLANLLFVRELDRRLRAHGDPVLAVAAHPGFASSNLSSSFVAGLPAPLAAAYRWGQSRLEQSDADGALPSLYAATMPDVRGGEYLGPDGFGEQRGAPTRVGRSARAQDDDTAARLWAASERLTGVTFPDLPAAPPR
ncbi:oxidoreductase [Cellulomonas marina]|uniref:Protochlorophyllide reductase n=1 Tax=Cellulomonas marina TaxID=988821 RepID=A0A1I0Y4U5_9CELL|nr:oxidoreductase [Cellulomonas marina]GIG29775.1 short-chain dehydrogenase [Cellulomonas marina]SFB07877.1 protochlorophyllide reductase [Cellulomonas marina]